MSKLFNFMLGCAIVHCIAVDTACRAVKGQSKMRMFNSLQVVAMYAASPWLLGLLFRQDFPFHTAACAAAIVLYGIYSAIMVGCVYTSSGLWDK